MRKIPNHLYITSIEILSLCTFYLPFLKESRLALEQLLSVPSKCFRQRINL